MTRRLDWTRAAALLHLILLLCPALPSSAAEPRPPLWGYGVKPCAAFLAVAPEEGTSAVLADGDYVRYREWLAGLVSGLNLATGQDVLRGAELDAALGRVRIYCQAHPTEDFFNASLRLFRALGKTGKE